MADSVVFKPLETALRNLLEALVAGETQRRAASPGGSNQASAGNPMAAPKATTGAQNLSLKGPV